MLRSALRTQAVILKEWQASGCLFSTPAEQAHYMPRSGCHVFAQVIDLELEPISYIAPQAMNAHVLRKPDLPISEDWTVEIVVKQ